MIFNDARLLDCVSYGSEFAMAFNTQIVTLRSGAERRNANWSQPLGTYSINYGALKEADHIEVIKAHMACMGAFIPFRFRDETDFDADNELLGIATGDSDETFQLMKTYSFGTIDFQRKISKPVEGTVTIFANGTPIAATIDYSTGLVIIIAAPAATITWSGEFDVPVRFDDDSLDVRPIGRNQSGFILSSDVTLREVRL